MKELLLKLFEKIKKINCNSSEKLEWVPIFSRLH